MKEIIAIIRPKKIGATKDFLETLGFPSVTAFRVLGRGKQKGLVGEVDLIPRPGVLEQSKSPGMKYVPKRQLSIVAPDDKVDEIVQGIIKINQTDQIGDGKIFICPLENAVRVRTKEEGEKAIL
ncbi:MAG: P-II family nitrogen regulator [Peptococcaceae bacterium]|nr:P-II family nitrogen regulator [Peptococcaceae bacterium]